MVPAVFVCLEELPLTPNGKVDRKALEKMEGVRLASGTDYVAPRTDTDRRLCAIWQQVLGLERVSIHDNFFDLGGHSLLATQVVLRVEQTLGVKLTVRDLFERPTIAELSGRLAEALPVGRPACRPSPVSGPLPLSFAQERLCGFLAQYEPDSTTYNLPEAFRLTGRLQADSLERALGEVMRRHESLRTTFRVQDGVTVQVIAPAAVFSLPMVDLSGQLEPQAQAEEIIAEELKIPFDLAARAADSGEAFPVGGGGSHSADQPAPQHQRWLVAGRAVPGTLGRLCRLAVGPAGLPAAAADAIRGLCGLAAPMAARRGTGKAAGLLAPAAGRGGGGGPAGGPSASPPADLSRGRTADERARRTGGAAQVVEPGTGGDAVYEPAGGVSGAVVPVQPQEDILVGVPIANRQRVEVEDLIGFFVNTLVMRGDLSGGPSFREVVKRARTVALEAYRHQDLPFEELVKELNPARDLSRHPLFQVMFAMQNAPEHALELAGLTFSVHPLAVRTTHFDLELHLWPREETWSGFWVYNTDLFEAATMSGWRGIT